LLEPASGSAAPDPAGIKSLRRKVHQTLQTVTRDFETFEFNTIISALMELMNEMTKLKPEAAVHRPGRKLLIST